MRLIATVIGVEPAPRLVQHAQGPPRRVADGQYWFKAEQFDRSAMDFGEYVTRKPDHVEMRYNLCSLVRGGATPRGPRPRLCARTWSPSIDKYLDLQARALFEAGEREPLVEVLSRASSEAACSRTL